MGDARDYLTCGELAEKAAELLLAYDTPVSLAFDISSEQADSDSALHFLMRHVMSAAHLPLAATEILANPHVRLIERLGVVSIEEIAEGHADLIADHLDVSVLGDGGPLARFFGGYTPRELPQREMIESHDTPENRYAKALLEHCRIIAQRLENRMGARGRRAAAREAHGWSLKLDELLEHGLWREVGSLGHIPANSQVMLAKRGYKELFRLDVALRMSLDLAWPQGAALGDGLVGDTRPVNQVYEYWCFFILREILQSICTEVGGGNFLTVAKDGLRIQLAKGRRSECRFHFTGANGVKLVVSLFYNKRFVRSKAPRPDWSGSYTASFDPDYSVAVRAAGGASATHWLHFDAKYRLEREQAEGLFDSPDDADEGGAIGTAATISSRNTTTSGTPTCALLIQSAYALKRTKPKHIASAALCAQRARSGERVFKLMRNVGRPSSPIVSVVCGYPSRGFLKSVDMAASPLEMPHRLA